MKDKDELKEGDAVIVTGNVPEYGKYKHAFRVGDKVFLLGWLPFPSGRLPYFSDNPLAKIKKQTRSVMDFDQFTIPSEA